MKTFYTNETVLKLEHKIFGRDTDILLILLLCVGNTRQSNKTKAITPAKRIKLTPVSNKAVRV